MLFMSKHAEPKACRDTIDSEEGLMLLKRRCEIMRTSPNYWIKRLQWAGKPKVGRKVDEELFFT